MIHVLRHEVLRHLESNRKTQTPPRPAAFPYYGADPPKGHWCLHKCEFGEGVFFEVFELLEGKRVLL
jgi:hypothetical protein